MADTYEAEVYPNSPLTEVVCEIRFPGELAVETERHRFWEKIRSSYPEILVPHPQSEQALALTPYRFRNAEKNMTIMVALNRFALSSTRYPGYKMFRREFMQLHKKFMECFSKLDKLNRVGWRYINIIPFVREKGLIPFDAFLQLSFKLPKRIPKKFRSIGFEFDAEMNGGSLTTRVKTLVNRDSGQEAFLLDFDYGAEREGLVFKNVPDYVDEAHKCTRLLFEDFITGQYRQYLRGETL